MRLLLNRRAYRQAMRKRIQLSDTGKAALASGTVLLGLLATQLLGLQAEGGYLIITMQSVASVNLRGDLRHRLLAAAVAAALQALAAALGVVCQGSLPLTLTTVAGMALAFGYLRQAFPERGAGIVIPAGVVFFITQADHRTWQPLAAVTGAGFAALALEALISLALAFFYTRPARKPVGLITRGARPVADTTRRQATWLGLKATYLIYSLELAACLVAGTTLVHFARFGHAYWLLFTVMVVLQEAHQPTRRRVAERVAGTLTGCLLGSGLLLMQPPPLVQMGLITVCMFAFIYWAGKRYWLASVFVTLFALLLLSAHPTEPLPTLILERLGSTVVGAGLALGISFLWLGVKERWRG